MDFLAVGQSEATSLRTDANLGSPPRSENMNAEFYKDEEIKSELQTPRESVSICQHSYPPLAREQKTISQSELSVDVDSI